MPWCQEAMKDVESCDKLGGAAERAIIPRFPNGTTQQCKLLLIDEFIVDQSETG